MKDTQTIHVYICSNSAEGILSAIHEAWSSKRGHNNNRIEIHSSYSMQLFHTYHDVVANTRNASSILSSIQKRISIAFYEYVLLCLSSHDPNRADDIYRLLILAFHMGESARYQYHLPYIQRLQAIERNVFYETHRFYGFIRFQEIKNGTLVAKFRPKNNIIISLLDHFSDRFPSERLVLIDLNRNIFGFSYLGDKHLVVASEMPPLIDHLETTQDEDLLSELWCCFVGTIAIKERTNKKLQQQHVPLRYQGEMVEFKKVLVQDPLSYLIPPV